MIQPVTLATTVFLFVYSACVQAETTVALTTTVHADATAEEKTLMQGLLPLLEVAVGKKEGVQVVERQQLDLAMHELILSNSIGKNASLQLGKLATADLILTAKLLKPDETGKQHVDVRITESLTGTIRGAVVALVERATVDETAREISQYLVTVVASPQLASISMSVAPFESLGRFDRLRPLERGLRDMVVARLRRYKGLRVLQRSEMQQLLTEIDLVRSGLVDCGELPATLPRREAAYHLRGTLDEQQTEGKQELLVGIELIHAESHRVVEKVAMTTTAEELTEDLAIEINRLIMSLAKKSNRNFDRPSAANKFDEVDQLFRLAVTDLYHFWRRKPRDFSHRDFRLPEFTPSRRTYGGRVKIDSPLGTALIRKSVDRLESVLYLQPERRDAQFALAWCFCCETEGLCQPERAGKLLRSVFESNRKDALAVKALILLSEIYCGHERGRCRKQDREKAWVCAFYALKNMPEKNREKEWPYLFWHLGNFKPDLERTARSIRMVAPAIERDGGMGYAKLPTMVVQKALLLAAAKGYPHLQTEANELLDRWKERELPQVQITILYSQLQQADHEEAATIHLQTADFHKKNNHDPHQHSYHYALVKAARSMRKANRADDALALLESFQPTDRGVNSLLTGTYGVELGNCLKALGRNDEALDTYVSSAEQCRGLVDNSDVDDRIKKLGGVPLSPDRDIDVRYVDDEKDKPFYCRSVATDGQRIFVGGDYRPPWSRGVTAYHPGNSRWEKLSGPEVRVSCLSYADGYLWAGTDKQGLWRCDLATSQWRQWNTSTDLPDNTVVDVLVHKGAAYVSVGGRNSGGVVRIDADQSVHVYQDSGAPRTCLYHLTTDGEKLCGVNKGLFELDLSSDVWHRREDAATGRPLHAMFIQYGPSGLWGSSYGKELFLVGASQEENARFKQAWFPRGLQKAGYSLDFAIERDGQVWFGGYPWWRFKSAGLYRFDLETGKFTIYGPRDGFRVGTIYQCYDGVWLKDQLWLATSEGLAEVTVRKPQE
ncbi:MAG: hypothetical protein GXP26_05610 [Planctomycetes bacterium]|nr:hypothetical protein [Planctomycetota bacterium]